MTVLKQIAGFVLVTTLFGGVAWAQGLRQPNSVRQVAFQNDSYYTTQEEVSDSPSDAAVTELGPTPFVEESSGGYSECDRTRRACGGCAKCCNNGKPWTMPQPCGLQRMGVRVGGWLQQGITFSGHNPVDSFNGPVATNDWDGEYQMNQAWVYLDRPADNGGCGWALGGHVDMLYGTDWRFGINHGLENRINSFDNSYGLVIPQAYMEVVYNRLSVKLGHFAGILDYEVVPAIANPFYSHSYSYGFTVPQLVTGALADYKLSDRVSVQAGVTRGWFMFEDINHHMDFMAGVKWASRDKRTTIAYAINTGPQDPAGAQDRFAASLVLTRQVTEKFKYVLVQNLGTENNGAANNADAEWYGLNQYFLYTINPCWAVNARFEWLRDDDGTRVAGPGSVFPIRAFGGSGFAGDFYGLTLGVSWRPNANLVIRPELRWDWYDGLAGAGNAMPFNDGLSDSQFLFGVDAIVTF